MEAKLLRRDNSLILHIILFKCPFQRSSCTISEEKDLLEKFTLYKVQIKKLLIKGENFIYENRKKEGRTLYCKEIKSFSILKDNMHI